MVWTRSEVLNSGLSIDELELACIPFVQLPVTLSLLPRMAAPVTPDHVLLPFTTAALSTGSDGQTDALKTVLYRTERHGAMPSTKESRTLSAGLRACLIISMTDSSSYQTQRLPGSLGTFNQLQTEACITSFWRSDS